MCEENGMRETCFSVWAFTLLAAHADRTRVFYLKPVSISIVSYRNVAYFFTCEMNRSVDNI